MCLFNCLTTELCWLIRRLSALRWWEELHLSPWLPLHSRPSSTSTISTDQWPKLTRRQAILSQRESEITHTHKILLTNSLQGCREAETRWCHHLYHSFFFSLTVHFPFYIPLIYILNIKSRLREEKKTQNINVGALMCALKSEQFVFIS